MPAFYHKIQHLGMEQESKRAIQHDFDLHQLISERKWNVINRTLAKDVKPNRFHSVNLSLINDHYIVHHACQHNAPLRTVVWCSMAFPSSVHTADENDRYPIHVAVAVGCDPDVILFLAQTYPGGAGAQDKYGKTPLHYAAESYAKTRVDNSPSFPNFDELHKNTSYVVGLLIKAAPQSVNVEDYYEMNPIEIAVLNHTHIKVIKAMQRASKRDWRRQVDERKSLEDLAKDTQDKSQKVAATQPTSSRRGTIHRHTVARMA